MKTKLRHSALWALATLLCAVLPVLGGARERQIIQGISGQVFIGPVCPVVPPGGDNCADQPFQSRIAIVASNGRSIGTIETDTEGRFLVALHPGNYTLIPEVPGPPVFYPYAPPLEVTVEPRKITDVTIRYDSGIE